MSAEEFRDWCNRHDFADLEERVWGEDNPYVEPDRYKDQLVCGGQVVYNKETGEVSGTLEAIEFEGEPSFRGDRLHVEDATWRDMDGPNNGEGSLTVKPKGRAFDDMDPVKFTVTGWR